LRLKAFTVDPTGNAVLLFGQH